MLRNRLPPLSDILRLASVVSTFLYGWTILAWFWQLPSWLLSLTLDEILSIFAYVVLSAFAETLTVLVCLLLLTFLLPPRLLRDDFIVRGSWLLITTLGSLLLFFILFNQFSVLLEKYIYPWSIVTLVLAVIFTYLVSKLAFMRSFSLWLSDRLQIFLFLFIPLTVISLVTVILRNII